MERVTSLDAMVEVLVLIVVGGAAVDAENGGGIPLVADPADGNFCNGVNAFLMLKNPTPSTSADNGPAVSGLQKVASVVAVGSFDEANPEEIHFGILGSDEDSL